MSGSCHTACTAGARALPPLLLLLVLFEGAMAPRVDWYPAAGVEVAAGEATRGMESWRRVAAGGSSTAATHPPTPGAAAAAEEEEAVTRGLNLESTKPRSQTFFKAFYLLGAAGTSGPNPGMVRSGL
jgi:hypothetical protein